LGLAVGGEAVALVKASSVLLVADDGTAERLSTRNRLRGTVSAVQRGAVNAEVSLTLEGGAVVTSVVTNESVAELSIAEGQALVAAFKASSVILGVTAQA
jgi:molybdate transport system regulatory protein